MGSAGAEGSYPDACSIRGGPEERATVEPRLLERRRTCLTSGAGRESCPALSLFKQWYATCAKSKRSVLGVWCLWKSHRMDP